MYTNESPSSSRGLWHRGRASLTRIGSRVVVTVFLLGLASTLARAAEVFYQDGAVSEIRRLHIDAAGKVIGTFDVSFVAERASATVWSNEPALASLGKPDTCGGEAR